MRAPFALLCALVLAGCVSLPDPSTPASGAAPSLAATTIPWELTECRYIVGWSNADPAVIQANLPEGFTVQMGGPLGLPGAGPAQTAIIGTEAFECASGSGLNGSVEPMLYASIWIPVSPPEALADPDVSQVYYKFDVLVPDAPRREAMLARGLPVGDGEIAWNAAAVPNGAAASFSIEGVGDFAFEMAQTRQVSPGDDNAPFMEITPAGEDGADGFAVWKADYAWVGGSYAQGQGTIEWPEGHWVTQAIGSTRAPGSFHAGTWSFTGTLSLPAGR